MIGESIGEVLEMEIERSNGQCGPTFIYIPFYPLDKWAQLEIIPLTLTYPP